MRHYRKDIWVENQEWKSRIEAERSMWKTDGRKLKARQRCSRQEVIKCRSWLWTGSAGLFEDKKTGVWYGLRS